MAVLVRRYSATHIVAQITVGGRGLYFSRTADGRWWRLRLRLRRRSCPPTGPWPEDPPGAGVREPRRPLGPGPLAASGELELP